MFIETVFIETEASTPYFIPVISVAIETMAPNCIHYTLLFTTVLSQWGFSDEKFRFPEESQLRQSRATQPTVHVGVLAFP